jgi:hypothetical protein
MINRRVPRPIEEPRLTRSILFEVVPIGVGGPVPTPQEFWQPLRVKAEAPTLTPPLTTTVLLGEYVYPVPEPPVPIRVDMAPLRARYEAPPIRYAPVLLVGLVETVPLPIDVVTAPLTNASQILEPIPRASRILTPPAVAVAAPVNLLTQQRPLARPIPPPIPAPVQRLVTAPIPDRHPSPLLLTGRIAPEPIQAPRPRLVVVPVADIINPLDLLRQQRPHAGIIRTPVLVRPPALVAVPVPDRHPSPLLLQIPRRLEERAPLPSSRLVVVPVADAPVAPPPALEFLAPRQAVRPIPARITAGASRLVTVRPTLNLLTTQAPRQGILRAVPAEAGYRPSRYISIVPADRIPPVLLLMVRPQPVYVTMPRPSQLVVVPEMAEIITGPLNVFKVPPHRRGFASPRNERQGFPSQIPRRHFPAPRRR